MIKIFLYTELRSKATTLLQADEILFQGASFKLRIAQKTFDVGDYDHLNGFWIITPPGGEQLDLPIKRIDVKE